MFGSRQSWCSDCWPVRCPHMSARRRPRPPARLALTMLSGSAATQSRTWSEPRRASQKTGAALVRYAGQPSRAAVRMRAIIVAGMVEDGLRLSTKCRNRGKTLGSLVARMEPSGRPKAGPGGSIRAMVQEPLRTFAIETAPARETVRRGCLRGRDAVCARDHEIV